MMKRASSISIVSLVVVFFALGLFPSGSALCRAESSYALLLQQTPSYGGTVSPEIGIHHYGCNAEVTLIAVPRPGYQFVYWLGDVLDPTSSTTTALLDEPKVIIAVFDTVEEGQIIVGQNAIVGGGGGGGGSFSSGSSPISPAASRVSGSSGGTPGTPTEGGDGTPETPPTEGDPGTDPPDYPPPDVPEPATGLMLTLGAVALLRKRTTGTTL